MDKLRIVVIILACVGIGVSGVMIFKTQSEYNAASKEYSNLEKYIEYDSKGENNTDEHIVSENSQKELRRNYNRSDFPSINIDYEGLHSVNEDYIGWLYVGGADISYPVVQGEDNDYYLHNTFERESNFAGCIFIDCDDKSDFSGWNTFVYGHAMKNGTMFGNLKAFRKNDTVYDEDSYIYMFLQDGIYRYKIYSYYIDKKDSEMYYSCDNLKQYRQYLRTAKDKSVRECDTEVSEEDNSITLVTCSGTASNKQRFFVHGIFVDRYLYE